MGLFKRCPHKGRNRDRCGDPWWGSFKGHRVSLAQWTNRDINTKDEAQAALDELRAAVRAAERAGLHGKAVRAALQAGRNGKDPGQAGQALTFRAFADLYVKGYVKLNALKSEDTITYRMEILKDHFGDRPLADIRTADIEDFLADLKTPAKLGPKQKTERARRPATINRYRSQLVQMFNWAVSRDYLERTPFQKGTKTLIPTMREDNKRDRRLSPEAETALLNAAAPHLKLLIKAALYSGMRRGEMLALTWADLDARPGWIRLRGDTTKSGKTRWVPMHPNVQAVFDFLKTDANGEDKPADAKVFSNEVGEPICYFQTAWKAALRRANITNYRWHDLRHEFASRLAERGVPLVQVRDLLGHASVTTTERYDTQQAERLRAAVQLLNQSEKPESDQQASDPAGQAGEAAPSAEVSHSLHSRSDTTTDPASDPEFSSENLG